MPPKRRSSRIAAKRSPKTYFGGKKIPTMKKYRRTVTFTSPGNPNRKSKLRMKYDLIKDDVRELNKKYNSLKMKNAQMKRILSKQK
jgi:hypothetical protein